MSNGKTIFLSGVDMHPSAIRELWPAARFKARAKIEAEPAEVNPSFAGSLTESHHRVTVWGLAVECPGAIEGKKRSGETDAGDRIEMILAELPLLAGDPETVLAAALYWELPPAYTAQLRQAAGVAEPEAEGGWESPVLEAEPPATGS